MGTHGIGTYLVNSKFASGNQYWFEKTVGRTTTGDIFKIGTTSVTVGNTANDIDLQWYGTTTGTFILDALAHTLVMTGMASTITGGALTMGATGVPSGDFTLWPTSAGSKVWLDVDGDTNGAFYFGANDYGVDVGFYGQTIANSMIWDASANALVLTAGGITMGTGSKLVIPVKASGSTTSGDFWLDTTDNYIHFYTAASEYIITGCVTV